MTDALHHSRFMKAIRRESVDATPVWLMRQAGRYMKEYRDVRSQVTFLELCHNPELAAKVTLDAQRILGVDAAILFADLLPILQPMGFELEYIKGTGPVIHNPVREPVDVDRVALHNAAETQHFVRDTIKILRRELPADIPLIGFAGLPFTLAAYCTEGGGSKNWQHTKRLMYSDEGAWNALCEKLSAVVIDYLKMQADAGVQVLQLFDSHVGQISERDYRRFVQPHVKRIISDVQSYTNIPMIHFGVGTGHLLEAQDEAGANVLGLDWRVPISEGRRRCPTRALQGNLDPVILFSKQEAVLDEAKRIIDDNAGTPGHVFNLGHGILPHTPVDNVKALVNFVHEYTAS